MHGARSQTARWLALAVGVAVASLACDLAGLPSPALFGALLVGILAALAAGWELTPSAPARTGAQVVIGVALGAYVQPGTVSEVGSHVLPIVAVSLATLALTVGAGIAMARVADVDRATASFGMIAGGASGIVAIAAELGADNRLVAVMQYLRLLVILVSMPLIAGTVFSAHGGGAATGIAALGPADAALYLTVSTAGGLALWRVTRLPAGALLGPMVVAGGLSLAGAGFAGTVPALVQDVAFAIIGLEVGLRFTPESLRHAGHILPAALGTIVGLIVGCAALGLLLAPLAGVSELDGYLATTPGGLYAVLATAVGSGANTTFVLAVQVLRLFLMLLAAPLVARRLAPSAAPRPVADAG